MTQVYQVHAIATSGAETKLVYDILNRETVRLAKDFTGSAFNSVNTAYDPQIGQPSRVTEPSAAPDNPATPASTYLYDSMGRPTSITLADGVGYAYTYGTTTAWSLTGPEGQFSSGADDGRGLVTVRSDFVKKPGDSVGHSVAQTYRYGPFGVLVGIDVVNGPTTTIGYDESGRRISLDDPDTGHSTYTWNGFGELVQETDANHKVTTYIRDGLGRIQQLVTADGVTTYEWDSAPNGIGRLAKTTSPDAVDCSHHYDGAGRLSSQTWTLRTGISGADGTYSIGIGYDAAGRPSAITYPAVAGQAPLVLNWTYTPTGMLSGVVRDAGAQALWTVNTRNVRGQVTWETMGNGVYTVYDHSATGLLRTVTSRRGGDTLRDLVYDYDGAHRLRQRTNDGQSVEIFQYDTIDRLVDWQTGATVGSPHTAYTYDDLGNLTLAQRVDGSSTSSTSFTPGNGITRSRHQIASSSLGSYGYDARGDQVAAPGRTVAYTSFGLPKSITTGTGTTSFAYDGAQARVLKVKGDAVVVSLGDLFERRIQAGQATDVFYAIADGKPVAQINWQESGSSVVEEVEYLHDDHAQSIETVTNAEGQVVARQRFEPFGARTSVAASSTRVGYQGAEQDDDLGLVNMKGRLYDPAQFRFISPDPMVPNPFFGQDLNRYAFVRNSPLNYRDPSGFDPVPQEVDQENPPAMPGCLPGTYCGTVNTDSGYATQAWAYGPIGSPVPIDSSGPAAAAGAADANGTYGYGPNLGGVAVDGGVPKYGAPGGDGGRPTTSDPRIPLLRGQELDSSCVPSVTRNAIVLSTFKDISEKEIRDALSPEQDFGKKGMHIWQATKVLQTYVKGAKEIYEGHDTVMDLARLVKNGPLIIGGKRDSGTYHAILLLDAAPNGRGGTKFQVLDPLDGIGGRNILPRWISQGVLKDFWEGGVIIQIPRLPPPPK